MSTMTVQILEVFVGINRSIVVEQYDPDVPPTRIVRRAPSTAGLSVAAIGYAAALTPSLLPRGLVFLILVTTLGTVTGYALGAIGGWAARKIPAVRQWQPPRWSVWVLLAALWLPALALTPVAMGWQVQQQDALAMPGTLPSTLVLIPVVLALAAIFLLIGRSIRLGSNSLTKLVMRGPLANWSVRWTRLGVAVVLVIAGNALLGVGFSQLTSSYNATNSDLTGQSPTNLGLNSGSAESLTPWETLGRQGRSYVANTMTPAQISAITDEDAQTPIRLYVGMDQADTPEARTALAIEELNRVDAWDREYLVLFGVTGTGWVDPDAINSLEVLTGGDVATIAVQYSAVPSWIGFVIDQATTIDQNSSMIEGIVAAWREQPEDARPELILFGQSLGAMGTQGAWDASATPASVTEDIAHVVWVGPPAASILWATWQAERTAGPAWDPVIGDDEITRVLISANDKRGDELKPAPTIVFVAHANDPVVYWSPSIAFSKPDWFDEPLGPGVMPQMRWIPLISFLQVGLDLVGGGEPPEVGHNYSANMAQSLALGVSPDGWTVEKTQRLNAALPTLKYETG